MSTIAIIPARGGSRRIPMKNVKPFFGKPIICYSIQSAIDSEVFDAIYISTDSYKIADEARLYFPDINILNREKHLAEDVIGTQVVMKYALDELNHHGRACCIYPCAPLINPNDLIKAESYLSPSIDYAFSVGDNPLHDAGQFYWGKSLSFRDGDPLIGFRTSMYLIPPERDCDINTYDDFARAELMYANLNEGY